MDYKNRLKGATTQILLKSLLEDAGYRIVPLGIEEVLRELSNLEQDHYKRLKLPETLRKLPDFFVADKNFDETYLVEVKYRKNWDQNTKAELEKTLKEQVKNWSPLLLLLFIGNSTKPDLSPSPAHFMKVLWLHYDEEENAIVSENSKELSYGIKESWDEFQRIQDVFVNVNEKFSEQTLCKTMSILQGIKELDLID